MVQLRWGTELQLVLFKLNSQGAKTQTRNCFRRWRIALGGCARNGHMHPERKRSSSPIFFECEVICELHLCGCLAFDMRGVQGR